MIGQAQGILMERERITADQAYDILRRAPQHLSTKIRDVAQALVDTGDSPQTGPPRPDRIDTGAGKAKYRLPPRRPPSTTPGTGVARPSAHTRTRRVGEWRSDTKGTTCL